MGRVPYLLGSTALFLSQHLIALGIAHHQHLRLAIGPYFWLAPWRPLLEQQFTRGLTFAVLCIGLLIGWLLAVLAFRRARDAWYGSFAACFVFVPLLQLLGIAVLATMPSAKRPEGADGAAGAYVEAIHSRRQHAAAVESLFLSAALSVAAVGAMTLLFGTYGFGLFVLGPFLLGCVTAFIARRNALHEFRQARDLTLAAAAIGMLGLSAYALEGAICILMASPLVLLVALIGAAVAHAATDPRSRLSVRNIAFIIPLFGVDAVAPPRGQFVSSASIDVAASPRDVWDSVVAMKTIA